MYFSPSDLYSYLQKYLKYPEILARKTQGRVRRFCSHLISYTIMLCCPDCRKVIPDELYGA